MRQSIALSNMYVTMPRALVSRCAPVRLGGKKRALRVRTPAAAKALPAGRGGAALVGGGSAAARAAAPEVTAECSTNDRQPRVLINGLKPSPFGPWEYRLQGGVQPTRRRPEFERSRTRWRRREPQ